MQRPVEQADRHRQARHRLEDPFEVGLLDRQQPVERRAPAVLVGGQDHLPHQTEPVGVREHVLGPAEPDPLGAELACLGRVLGVVGVRPHAQAPHPVGPLQHRGEVVVDLRRHERDRADDHLAGAAVDRDRVALLQLLAGEARRSGPHVDVQGLAARDAGRPHPARDDGRVRGETAVGGQDPGRLHHPVEVVGRRLPADEDDALARLAARLGGVGVEDDGPGGRSRGGVQTLRDDLELCAGVDHRVQQLVELRRVDPRDRFLLRDQPFLDHLHRSSQCRRRRALRRPGLQQEEIPLLDRELDVLHVAVVLLEPPDRLQELRVGLGKQLVHPLDRLRRADSRDDVLALRVLEELAVELALARGRVAREADAGAGAVALVAEDHLDDVDGGAEVVRNVVGAPVDLGTRRVPGLEDGAHGLLELGPRILRERAAGLGRVRVLERLDQLAEVGGGQLDVLLHAARRLHVRQRLLEAVPLDAVDHLAVHLDQPPVGVVGEALVAGRLRQPCDRLVVEAEVEDRVHHPRHRDGGARADGDEQRIVRIAEALRRLALERGDVLRNLGVEPVRQLAAAGHVRAARVGRDREARRDGNAERGHLGEPDSLAAEQLAPAAAGVLVEVVDVAHRRGIFPQAPVGHTPGP